MLTVDSAAAPLARAARGVFGIRRVSRQGSAGLFLAAVTALAFLPSVPVSASSLETNPAKGAPTFAYVTNNRSPGSVTPFSTATNMRRANIAAGNGPQQIAITPDGKTAYVTNSADNTVTPITLATRTAGVAIPVGSAPLGIAITPNGSTAYVANSGSNTVTPITLATNTAGAPIPVGVYPAGVAVTPDGKTVYVANHGGSVMPIAVATNTPGSPISFICDNHGDLGDPYGLSITPDGATLYVTNPTCNTVTPLPTATNVAGSSFLCGSFCDYPYGIAITPDGKTAYVASEFGVYPIDLSTHTPGSTIGPGAQSWFWVAVTPDGKTAYATQSSGVLPIAVATNTAGSEISGFRAASGISITPDQAPIAKFGANVSPHGSPTQFDANRSFPQSSPIATYTWSFGDGTASQTLTSPLTSHVYASAGAFNVKLTLTDVAGTSTALVFTGQTVSRLGSAIATATRKLTIS